MNELLILKSQLGGKLSSVQMRDANAERQRLSAQSNEAVYINRLAFSRAGLRIEVVTNQELARVSVFGEFNVPFFTVHSQDRGGFTSFPVGRIRIGSLDDEVFTRDGTITDAQYVVLRSAELAEVISAHQFRSGEALHFYRNGLVLYARVEDVSSILVRHMIMLAEIAQASNDATELDLPIQFADLQTVLKDWGKSDDIERSEKINEASTQELRQFLEAVEPRLPMINSHFSASQECPVSYANANLGRIVEAVVEARVALSRRTAHNN